MLKYNENSNGEFVDYNKLKKRENAVLPNIGYRYNEEITFDTLKTIAQLHGGKLLSDSGDITDRLEWENSDGERFSAKGSTVLAGHWLNPSYRDYCWDFDRLAKKDKIYADIWYDSHDLDEDYFYYYDEKFNAKYNKIKG